MIESKTRRDRLGINIKVWCKMLRTWFAHEKPGFHMTVTVGDASLRQARGHIGDGCVKWKHFLNDVADQTGTVRGRIERVEMSLKPGFHMIITVIVSICRRLIGDTSPKRRRLLRSYRNQAKMNKSVVSAKFQGTKTSTRKRRNRLKNE